MCFDWKITCGEKCHNPARRKTGPGTSDKVFQVTFMGAGGQSVTVDCPEVGLRTSGIQLDP
jgi:hypothetical protein